MWAKADLSKLLFHSIDLKSSELKEGSEPFETTTGYESEAKVEYMQTFFNRVRMELVSEEGSIDGDATTIMLFDHQVKNGVDSPVKPAVSFLKFSTFEVAEKGFNAKFSFGQPVHKFAEDDEKI